MVGSHHVLVNNDRSQKKGSLSPRHPPKKGGLRIQEDLTSNVSQQDQSTKINSHRREGTLCGYNSSRSSRSKDLHNHNNSSQYDPQQQQYSHHYGKKGSSQGMYKINEEHEEYENQEQTPDNRDNYSKRNGEMVKNTIKARGYNISDMKRESLDDCRPMMASVLEHHNDQFDRDSQPISQQADTIDYRLNDKNEIENVEKLAVSHEVNSRAYVSSHQGILFSGGTSMQIHPIQQKSLIGIPSNIRESVKFKNDQKQLRVKSNTEAISQDHPNASVFYTATNLSNIMGQESSMDSINSARVSMKIRRSNRVSQDMAYGNSNNHNIKMFQSPRTKMDRGKALISPRKLKLIEQVQTDPRKYNNTQLQPILKKNSQNKLIRTQYSDVDRNQLKTEQQFSSTNQPIKQKKVQLALADQKRQQLSQSKIQKEILSKREQYFSNSIEMNGQTIHSEAQNEYNNTVVSDYNDLYDITDACATVSQRVTGSGNNSGYTSQKQLPYHSNQCSQTFNIKRSKWHKQNVMNVSIQNSDQQIYIYDDGDTPDAQYKNRPRDVIDNGNVAGSEESMSGQMPITAVDENNYYIDTSAKNVQSLDQFNSTFDHNAAQGYKNGKPSVMNRISNQKRVNSQNSNKSKQNSMKQSTNQHLPSKPSGNALTPSSNIYERETQSQNSQVQMEKMQQMQIMRLQSTRHHYNQDVSNNIGDSFQQISGQHEQDTQQLSYQDVVLESTEVDLQAIKQIDGYTETPYKEAIYLGIIINGMRHGKGVMKYRNGRQYEGFWNRDLRDGRGFERYPNGNTYFGQFKYGKAHGKGVYTWQNGEVYDGEWDQGLKQGYGIWKGILKDSYIGEWSGSKAHGYGVHTWPNGDRYEGQWKMCLKHGQGTDAFANGDTYTGEYVDGKPHGKGEYTWKNGQYFIGEFVKGIKQGQGKWKSSKNHQNCNVYEGDYQNDKKHGRGVFTWASGNIYKGDYFDDERHGNGQMLWTDGSMYEGEWYRGIQHGFGRMVFPTGDIKEGYFENNIFKCEIKPNGILKPQSGVRGQGAFSPPQNQMRSTKASSGFQSDKINQNPYELNQLAAAKIKQNQSNNQSQLSNFSNLSTLNRSPFSRERLKREQDSQNLSLPNIQHQTLNKIQQNQTMSNKTGVSFNLVGSPEQRKNENNLDESITDKSDPHTSNNRDSKLGQIPKADNVLINDFLNKQKILKQGQAVGATTKHPKLHHKNQVNTVGGGLGPQQPGRPLRRTSQGPRRLKNDYIYNANEASNKSGSRGREGAVPNTSVQKQGQKSCEHPWESQQMRVTFQDQRQRQVNDQLVQSKAGSAHDPSYYQSSLKAVKRESKSNEGSIRSFEKQHVINQDQQYRRTFNSDVGKKTSTIGQAGGGHGDTPGYSRAAINQSKVSGASGGSSLSKMHKQALKQSNRKVLANELIFNIQQPAQSLPSKGYQVQYQQNNSYSKKNNFFSPEKKLKAGDPHRNDAFVLAVAGGSTSEDCDGGFTSSNQSNMIQTTGQNSAYERGQVSVTGGEESINDNLLDYPNNPLDINIYKHNKAQNHLYDRSKPIKIQRDTQSLTGLEENPSGPVGLASSPPPYL